MKNLLKFENEKPGSVTLVKFSRYILGLSLLYAKSGNDLAIWNSDFIPYLTEIKKFLDTDKEGKLFNKFLNKLEVATFVSLNHQLDIDFKHLISILKANCTLETIESFTEACKGLDNDCSKGFSQMMKDIEAQMINLQFTVDFDSDSSPKITDENLENTPLQKNVHVNSTPKGVSILHRLGIFKLFALSGVELSDQTNVLVNKK